ncbi:MAG TPA: hydantoinase/oxoprolinase N-terminal domain-containing protein, partial [Candidatus Methylomirabilis sp.]|nr:hydantoinase/oxoprolinase N-terminal domain-containing protein [Candidatus Methylomirabilis sp.]
MPSCRGVTRGGIGIGRRAFSHSAPVPGPFGRRGSESVDRSRRWHPYSRGRRTDSSAPEGTVTDSHVRLAVDIGGTFTDVVVETARGRRTKKVLTTPAAPEEGVMAGMLGALAEAGLAVPA